MKRRPKQLAKAPSLYEPAEVIRGGALVAAEVASRDPGHGRRGPGATVFTGEDGQLEGAGSGRGTVDPQVRAAARRIASRLALPPVRRDSGAGRGSGDVQSVPYRDGLDEIDIERTLDVLAERRFPDAEEIIVRDRVSNLRAVVLLIDVSGSMRGERVRTAAAALGALGAELSRDRLAVLAFWSDAAWLVHFGASAHPERLVDTLLEIPARGLTNLAFPLDLAARELARVRARDERVLLLSDCVHNAGPDPRGLAARLPRLDVLLDVTGESDLDLGRELARVGHGRIRPIRHERDVGPALNAVFAP